MTTIPLTSRRGPARLAAAIVALLLVGAFAGCSASGSPKGAERAGAQSVDDWQVQFAKCMREQGIDYPDPAPGGGESGSFSGDVDDFQAMEDARRTCTKELGPMPEPEGAPIRADDVSDGERRTAKCLRDNGVDVADPTAGMGLSLPADVPEDVLRQCLQEAR